MGTVRMGTRRCAMARHEVYRRLLAGDLRGARREGMKDDPGLLTSWSGRIAVSLVLAVICAGVAVWRYSAGDKLLGTVGAIGVLAELSIAAQLGWLTVQRRRNR